MYATVLVNLRNIDRVHLSHEVKVLRKHCRKMKDVAFSIFDKIN